MAEWPEHSRGIEGDHAYHEQAWGRRTDEHSVARSHAKNNISCLGSFLLVASCS